jgi:hypothetical protein
MTATAINFEQIKTQLVTSGDMRAEDAPLATSNAIVVAGEYGRSGSINVTSTRAGVHGPDVPLKTVRANIELPNVVVGASYAETLDAFKSSIEAMYPGVDVYINVM